MESALITTPRSFSASSRASADLPLAVGPAMRMISGPLTTLTYCAFPRMKILQEKRAATVTLIKPFRALRPAPGRAADILAPPYDVLSSAEARGRAAGKPWSFLHVSKAEIDLDPAIDPYDRAVYAKAAENLRGMIAAGALVRDEKPCYYAYRLTWRDRVETGFAAVASLAAYAENRIRKHELTTPVKEDDRVRQIEAVDAQTGPVMLAYPTAPAIDALLEL